MNTDTSTFTNNLEWALFYASLGRDVFPIEPKTKDRFFRDNEHLGPKTDKWPKGNPYSWKAQATTDQERIIKYWTQHPDANIGMGTGKSTGVVAIDIDLDEDTGEDGYQTVRAWEAEHGPLPDTWRDLSGRGGARLYYRIPEGKEYKNAQAGDVIGIDIRGNGGYTLLAPSIHPNGKPYTWECGFGPDEVEMATVDDNVQAFLDYVYRIAGSRKKVKTEDGEHVLIGKGGRHAYLISQAGILVNKCWDTMTDDEITAVVMMKYETDLDHSVPFSKPKEDTEREIRDHVASCRARDEERRQKESEIDYKYAMRVYKKNHPDEKLPDKLTPEKWAEIKAEGMKAKEAGEQADVPATTDPQPCPQHVVNQEPTEGPKAFKVWNVKKLQQAEIPKPYFCVEGMIPQGLTVLASPPKYGKTWLGLDMCIQVANGDDFLGFKTRKGDTLYIDLETYPGAMKDRVNLISDGLETPDGFNMIFKEDTMDMAHGFVDQLEAYRVSNPGLNLVVIDVLQKVKYPQKKGELLYDTEYRTGQELSKWGQDHNVCVVALTHTTKFVHDDPLECVSGSNGVTGSADSVIVLQKDDRFGKNATMSIMCRYAESGQHNIQFDSYRWHNLGALDFGTRADLERKQHVKEYQETDTRLKLIQFMATKKEWKGRAGQLKEEALEVNIPFMDNAKAIGGFLCNRDNRAYLYEVDNIRVEVIENGTSSKIYHLIQLTDREILEEEGFTDDRDDQAKMAFTA